MNLLLPFVVALQLGGTTATLSSGDSAKLIRRVEKAQEDFFLKWRREWADSEINQRKRSRERPDSVRLLALGCTKRDVFGMADSLDPMRPRYTGVDSLGQDISMGGTAPRRPLSAQSRAMMDRFGTIAHPNLISNPGNVIAISTDVCPIWVTDADEPSDARFGVDQELDLVRRAQIQWTHRRPLLTLLDSAAALLPGDGWIAGQRVRMHLDQGDLGAVRRAVDECRASVWWCTGLRGLMHYWLRDLSTADRMFQDALEAMPEVERCKWRDASSLLGRADSIRYAQLICAQRDSLDATLWWLADPLWMESGNDRRAEHFGRRFLIAIRGSMPLDERWDWRERKGGIAREELVERYGWPTQMRYWGGMLRSPRSPFGPPMNQEFVPIDGRTLGSITDGTGILGRERAAREAMSTVVDHSNVDDTTIEYWGPQYHTVPPLDAILDPFSIRDTTWDLGPERYGPGAWNTLWWAPEFFRRDAGALLGLPYQVAQFRRARAALIASAAVWDSSDFVPAPRQIVLGALLSTGPSSGITVTADTLRSTTSGSLLLAVRPRPQLMGLEMMPRGSSGPARRARFAISPPAALSTLGSGLGLSDPMLTRVEGDDQQSMTLGQAVGSMLPTTVLNNPRRLGVFWENYGLAAGDTGTVAMRLVRRDDRNVARRVVGNLVGVGSSDSLLVRWRPQLGTADVGSIDAGVSIRPAFLALDVSALPAGHYVLELILERPGQPTATSRREFDIVR